MDSVEDLNISSRDASHNWYGYHYQAVASVLYFLREINEKLGLGEDIEKIKIKIEYIEDFVIFNGDKIISIFQAKKILDNSKMKQVYKDFLLEKCYLGSENQKWIIISDNQIKKINFEKFKKLYEKKFKDIYKNELKEIILKINKNDKDYLIKNFALYNGDSKLRKTRQIINNIIKRKTNKNINELNCEEFKKFIYDDVEKLIQSIDNMGDSINLKKFYESIENKQCSIKTLEEKINEQINLLDNNGIKLTNIREKQYLTQSLIILVYEKLKEKAMKDSDELIITISDIKKELLSQEFEKSLYNSFLNEWIKDIGDILDELCSECKNKKCEEQCIVHKVKVMDLESAINNFNLEHPKDNIGKNIIENCSNKGSMSKIEFFGEVIDSFKNNKLSFETNKNNDIVVFNNKIMISWLITKRIEKKLRENYVDHIEIYKEYDEILTKEYNDILIFQHLYKNEYEKEFKRPNNSDRKGLLHNEIKFVSKDTYK